MEPIETSDQLWAAVAGGRPALLMLDYDGTLAPFHVQRDKAVPLAEVPSLLTAIAALPATTVAVVSGRPVLELLRLLGSVPVLLVGEHGWESRPPKGPLVKYALPEAARVGLREAASQASSRGWASSLEMKRTSVVLHTRGLPPPRTAALEQEGAELWRRFERPGLLRLEHVDGGLELRAEGYGKGVVVRDLTANAPADAICVFIGDDITDEDAFAELHSCGLGIIVAPQRTRSTLARATLASPDDVRSFLLRWLSVSQSRTTTVCARELPLPLNIRPPRREQR